MDDRTVNKEMSKASQKWAESILASYCIKHDRATKVEDGDGSFDDPSPYKWTIQLQEGEAFNMTKHVGSQGALEWLKQNFLLDGPYDLKLVTGTKLPKVKGSGKTDILIGLALDINKGSTFDFARGIVELKTDKDLLKVGQTLLQLLSLSMASTLEKGVMWELFYFSDATTITSNHGSKVCDDFLQLLDSIDECDYVGKNKIWILLLPEVAEQYLVGFDLSDQDKKAKAEEEILMLEHFADKLGEIYGEWPTIPWWAHVDAKIPDYYA